MKSPDRTRFFVLLTGVHDFYGKELSAFAGEVWMQACERFDVEQVSKALSAHLMDPERGQFMPKPADIVRQLQGTHTDRSLLAWGKVHNAMERVGAYESVDFGDDATHAAIMDMGGWAVLCRSKVDELPFLQRRFTESHRVYSQRGSPQAPRVLMGEFEGRNRIAGQPTAPPVVLGARTEPVRLAAA